MTIYLSGSRKLGCNTLSNSEKKRLPNELRTPYETLVYSIEVEFQKSCPLIRAMLDAIYIYMPFKSKPIAYKRSIDGLEQEGWLSPNAFNFLTRFWEPAYMGRGKISSLSVLKVMQVMNIVNFLVREKILLVREREEFLNKKVSARATRRRLKN